jgi:hypothetical protein
MNHKLLTHREMTASTLKVLFHNLPHDSNGDRLFAYVQFLSKHERQPTEEMIFNDVLYRIKASDEIIDPLRVFTTDKELMKTFVSSKVGQDYVIPTLLVLRSENEIAVSKIPANSCIKPTHLSGAVLFSDNEGQVDREQLRAWFNKNYYMKTREANYKSLTPKIIIEPILFDDKNIVDYKFFCYKGVPKCIQVDLGRRLTHTRNLFDLNWKDIGITLTRPRFDGLIPRPDSLEEMAKIASILSAPFSFVRIDFYCKGKSIYVGEITHCHEAANGRFGSFDEEMIMSRLIFET